MKYNELRKKAKVMGLTFSKTPNREQLEKAIAEVEAEASANNNPSELRAQAATLRAQAAEIADQAQKAEERAIVIERAQTALATAMRALHKTLVGYRDSANTLESLGIGVVWPIPRKIVRNAISDLTPPKHVYVFWAEGGHPVARGYIVAESFEEAKSRVLVRSVDYGATHPGTCGWPAATEKALVQLQENGEVRCDEYSTTVRTQTLEAIGIYRFDLTGPEYAGYAVVVANSFEEAKTKALAEEVIGGEIDLSQWELSNLAELKIALAKLAENGQVEHASHVLTAKTIV